jgi:hypothetical protein
MLRKQRCLVQLFSYSVASVSCISRGWGWGGGNFRYLEEAKLTLFTKAKDNAVHIRNYIRESLGEPSVSDSSKVLSHITVELQLNLNCQSVSLILLSAVGLGPTGNRTYTTPHVYRTQLHLSNSPNSLMYTVRMKS